MNKWEYTIIFISIDRIDESGLQHIQKLGNQGWELIAVIESNKILAHYFKRKI